MFIVTVHFSVHPGSVEAFMPAMLLQAKNSLSLEPGCRQFDVVVSDTDPTQIFLYEKYSDKAAFDEHLAMPHFKIFDQEVAHLVRSKHVKTWVSAGPAQ